MKQFRSFHAFFKKLNSASRLKEFEEHCEARDVEERWADDEMFDLRPLSHELSFRTGKWLKGAPKDIHYKHLYRLDAQGRQVTERMEMRNEYYHAWRETFYIYESNVTLAACYEHEIIRRNGAHAVKLVVLERLAHEQGNPVRYERLNALSTNGYIRFEYGYQDRRIAKVKTADNAEGSLQHAEWIVSHDPDGQVSRIDAVGDGECPAIRWPYRRRSKPLSLRQLSNRIEELLYEEIVSSVYQAQIKEPVFSLVLAYSSGGEIALPPYLGLGTQRERIAWTQQSDTGDLAHVMWNPEEYQFQARHIPPLLLENAELEHLFRYYLELHGSKDPFVPSLKLLRKVAKRLTKHDWRGMLEATGDFVALAYDVDNPDETKANIKASAPPSLVKRFAKNRWL